MTHVDLPSVARGVGRGFTVMLVGGLLVVALASVLQAATGVVLTLMAIAAFASAAWDVPTPAEGALAGAGTYLLFLPLAIRPPPPDLDTDKLAETGALAVGYGILEAEPDMSTLVWQSS